MVEVVELNRVNWYVNEIIQNQDRLTYLSLLDPDNLSRSIYYKIDRFGISTIAIKSKDLLPHQLLGIMSFRLREYLKLGWVDPELVYNQNIFHEPLQGTHDEDIHILSMNHQNGEILCYLCIYTMERHGDLLGTTIGAEDRPLFPCESAHGKGILKEIDWLKNKPIQSVKEIKRFVKSGGKDEFGNRASLEVLTGLACVTRYLQGTMDGLTAYVGDLELKGALRHINLLGMNVFIIQYTVPVLPSNELFAQMYIKRDRVLPFIMSLPNGSDEACMKEELLNNLLEGNENVSSAIRKLMRENRPQPV